MKSLLNASFLRCIFVQGEAEEPLATMANSGTACSAHNKRRINAGLTVDCYGGRQSLGTVGSRTGAGRLEDDDGRNQGSRTATLATLPDLSLAVADGDVHLASRHRRGTLF